MEKYTELLSKIGSNNKVRREKVKKVLVLIDLKRFYIGDTCIHVSRFKKTREYYPNAIIDANTVNSKHHSLITPFLQNNPYVGRYDNLAWTNIDFSSYDVIICGCIPEQEFLDFLYDNLAHKILDGSMTSAIFSAAGSIGFEEEQLYGKPVLPVHTEYNAYELSAELNADMLSNELFISQTEETWAADWLKGKGLEEGEELYVFLDSASIKDKLLRIDVYFDVLSAFLTEKNVKILLFDEAKIGKKEFYEAWLGQELSKKLIFVEGLSIREAFCLLGNSSIKFIFGPSTGLLHCASGIYTVMSRGRKNMEVPLMISYNGIVENRFVEHLWWNGSLVDGIALTKDASPSGKIISVKELDINKKVITEGVLSCPEFTSGILINYIRGKFMERVGRKYNAVV
ncbi:MAG: hypothetical protein JWO09_12 [Bacteroidetes bacterium]|nr:hypothetical protein [Bacteroidota bacterium]